MQRWYSARGVRRGLRWSAVITAGWLCWAAGYGQAARTHPTWVFSEMAAGACHPNAAH